jgi:hypothetical protein
MRGAGLAALVASMRQLLAVVVAMLSIAGAGYLLSHKLSNPDHFVYEKYTLPGVQGSCPANPAPVITPGGLPIHDCEPPIRAAWQIPLAILLAILGLGAAGAVGKPGLAAARPISRLAAPPPA